MSRFGIECTSDTFPYSSEDFFIESIKKELTENFLYFFSIGIHSNAGDVQFDGSFLVSIAVEISTFIAIVSVVAALIVSARSRFSK